ncbi:1-acyl-sn-glycerol-3-phosphate acyltransferase [bacterium]|nr:MAG: 1-acyl-sn-glycerol-3-phosphate acyltransferase [bacterium]MCL4229988.1 1-acyl-sn-glycerol-3-phosphate acyltransferase [Dehalococcoidia bacterium]
MRRFVKLSTYVPACYWWATFSLRAFLTVVARWKVVGRENVPPSGALIVVSNHLNNADPPILAAAVARRRIRYMAKVELFKWPFGIFPRLYGAFPVRRFEADVAAMLNAERILKRGEVLGMFPEGTRSRTGSLGKPHPGTALIALRTGATLLPCAIAGTEVLGRPWNALRRPRFTVVIGRPMTVERVRRPGEKEVNELTERLFAEICKLLPAQYLGAYTGSGDSSRTDDGTDPPSQ